MNPGRPAWLHNWLARHRTRVSLVLHALGIPLTIAAGVVLAVQLYRVQTDPSQWDLWWRPPALFVAGYVLQYLGHRYEGNDMGEVILVKKWLGLPYVAEAPRRDAGG